MAGRLKKDATAALSELEKYFHQDSVRGGMVARVQKYVASLRQSISNVNATNDDIDRRLQAMGRQVANAKLEAEKATGELRDSNDLAMQLLATSHTLRRTISDLEKRVSSPTMPYPLGDKLAALFNAVRRAFRVAPPFYGPPEERTQFFCVDDFQQHDTGEGFVLIGKFVVMQTGIGHSIGFLARTTDRLGSCGLSEKVQGIYVAWSRSWIDYGKRVKRLEPGGEEKPAKERMPI